MAAFLALLSNTGRYSFTNRSTNTHIAAGASLNAAGASFAVYLRAHPVWLCYPFIIDPRISHLAENNRPEKRSRPRSPKPSSSPTTCLGRLTPDPRHRLQSPQKTPQAVQRAVPRSRQRSRSREAAAVAVAVAVAEADAGKEIAAVHPARRRRRRAVYSGWSEAWTSPL